MWIKLSKSQLRGVSEKSGVMGGDLLYFIDPEVKRECIGLLKKRKKCNQSMHLHWGFLVP